MVQCDVVMANQKKKTLLARDQEFSGRDAFHRVLDDI